MPESPTHEVQHCYRHPDRETLLSCSQCERPICTSCMNPAPVGIRCPECAGKTRSAADQVQRGRSFRGISAGGRQFTVTLTLIIINVLVFVAEFAQSRSIDIGVKSSVLIRGGLYGPAVADGETWRIVTSAFIHESVLHVAFNLWVLWAVGVAFESYVGSRRMVLVYGISLLWASAGALLVSPGVLTIGASGAIFGVMGALVVMFRQRGVAVMQSGLGVLIGLNLVFTLTVPGVSIGGHIGGLVGGILAGAVLSGFGRGHIAYGRVTSSVAAGVLALALIRIAVGLLAAHGVL
jgi:membrane associated rhomboid family serine protease